MFYCNETKFKNGHLLSRVMNGLTTHDEDFRAADVWEIYLRDATELLGEDHAVELSHLRNVKTDLFFAHLLQELPNAQNLLARD